MTYATVKHANRSAPVNFGGICCGEWRESAPGRPLHSPCLLSQPLHFHRLWPHHVQHSSTPQRCMDPDNRKACFSSTGSIESCLYQPILPRTHTTDCISPIIFHRVPHSYEWHRQGWSTGFVWPHSREDKVPPLEVRCTVLHSRGRDKWVVWCSPLGDVGRIGRHAICWWIRLRSDWVASPSTTTIAETLDLGVGNDSQEHDIFTTTSAPSLGKSRHKWQPRPPWMHRWSHSKFSTLCQSRQFTRPKWIDIPLSWSLWQRGCYLLPFTTLVMWPFI